MIEATINPETWKQVIEAVAAVMTDIRIEFKTDGMSIAQMTSDKSSMVGILLTPADFEFYNCTKDREIILGIAEPAKIMKRLDGISEIQLHNDEDGPDSSVFNMTLIGDKKKRMFTLPILMPEKEERKPTIPSDVKYDSDFTMAGSVFSSIIKDMKIMTHEAKFFVDANKITVKGVNDTGGEVRLVYDEGLELKTIDKRIDDNEPLSAKYRINPLEDLSKAIVDEKEDVKIQMSHEQPMWIEMTLGKTGILILLLSPVMDRRR